jgi:ABC-type transport system involved in cytochrome c biogenesis ATPase subunit
VQALAKALVHNTSLKELCLYNISSGQRGKQALAKMLTQNTSLKKLDFTYNQIGDQETRALAEALQRNFYLEFFSFLTPQIEQFCHRNQKGNVKRLQFQIFFFSKK